MNKILTAILLLINLISCNSQNDYKADAIEIFKSTPVWKAADAIKHHDLKGIEKQLKNNPGLINYAEPKFKISLLYWTMYNSQSEKPEENYYEEAKLLVRLGANPYDQAESNVTPLMRAASVYEHSFKYIALCLESNYTRMLSDSSKRIQLSEALLLACGKMKEELAGVKLLLDSGADINYYSIDSVNTPLAESITQENMMIAKYLIIDRKAEYDISVKRMVDKVDLSIRERLLNLHFTEELDKEKIWQEIVAYIKKDSN